MDETDEIAAITKIQKIEETDENAEPAGNGEENLPADDVAVNGENGDAVVNPDTDQANENLGDEQPVDTDN